MVKKLGMLCLWMCLFFALSFTVCASEEIRVEQLNGEMPNIEVYFYSEETVEEATLALQGEEISATEITQVGEKTNHYFFLVDCSGSITTSQMTAIKTAISELVENKSAEDTVTLIGFGTTVDVLVDAQTDSQTIVEAVETLVANQSDTLFFDALAKAATMAGKLPEMDRCLLYVFSDSVDYNLGGYTEDEVEELLNNAGLPLYGFGFDSGTKESLDNFGALARATGGAIAIVDAGNLVETFQDTVDAVNSAYIASFTFSSNVLPDKGEIAKFTVQGSTYEISTNITEYISDEIVPEIVSVTQLTNGDIEIVFSEDVVGANVTDNFIVKNSGGVIIPVSSAVYEEELNKTTLTFLNAPESGMLYISTSNINDVSQDENVVANTIEVEYINEIEDMISDGTTGESQEENNSDMIQAYLGLLILVIIIAVAIIIIVINKKKKAKELEQQDDEMQGMNQDVQHMMMAGETGKAHFEMSQEPQKVVVLEVANISGTSNRVELAIVKTMFVGRSDICDVVFDDVKMSRQHFVIEDTVNGFVITNLSQGGTMLNGVSINTTRPIQYGDIIEAGAQRIVFKTR